MENESDTINNYLEYKYGNKVSTVVKMTDDVRNLFPKIKLKDIRVYVKKFINSEIDSKLLSTPNKKQPNNFTISPYNYRWYIDLIDMKNYPEENNGYNWILTCIDSFSRFAYAAPLKKKEGKQVNKEL